MEQAKKAAEQSACGCEAERTGRDQGEPMHSHDADGCACGHDHAHGDQKLSLREVLPLILAAALFAAGFLSSGTVRTALFFIAYALAGTEVLLHAAKGIIKGRLFDEQVLMSVATLGALALGDIPEAAAVMIFYRAGEWLQDLAVRRSRQRISDAVELHPDKATVLRADGQRTVDPAEVSVGETILVKVGERVPLDGEVVSGQSRLDVSMLTGEPEPVAVREGDHIQAGAVNTLGAIQLRVTAAAAESATGRLLKAVEDASSHKPAMERFITRFSRVYTPCVVAAAALVALIPPLLGLGEFTLWLRRALIFLVISCPCALVLSIPLTFFAGLAVTSKNGVLCKGADALEALAEVKAAVLDKTGTLTKGQFKVQQVVSDLPEAELLSLAAALEKDSLHPIAYAIVGAADSIPEAGDVRELAGRGVAGTVRGKRVLVGNRRLMAEENVSVPAGAQGALVAVDGVFAGEIHVGDELRSSARAAIGELNRAVGTTVILTGDEEKKAVAAAKSVGATEVYFSLSPQDKLKIMRDVRLRVGKTLFVGDGINDAPVLAGSDVGIAMGLDGTEMAAEAADALLLTDDLTRLPFAVRAAKLTLRTARENVAIALAIKTAAMALAALGFAGMWAAVVADVGAALVCVFHALGLFRRAK